MLASCLPQPYVQSHHQSKADGEEEGAQVGVTTLRHFRDEFFHDDVEHGSSGETEKIRQEGDDVLGRQDGQESPDGLNDTGKSSAEKGFWLAHTLGSQGHGDNGSFREVLDGDAQGESQCAGGSDLCISGQVACVHDADGHAFRDVVECDGQQQHGRALQMDFWPFRLFAVSMEMRDDVIQQKQKQYSAPESDRGRGEGETPHPGGLFNGRDQQAPH